MDIATLLLVVVEIILLFITFWGNLLVLVVILKDSRLWKAQKNIYVISITAVDLINGSFTISFVISWVICEEKLRA